MQIAHSAEDSSIAYDQRRKITWRKRLLQLISFLGVKHTQSVQVPRTADLEFDDILAPLYLHRARILPPRGQKEILNLVYLLRLCHVIPKISEICRQYITFRKT